MNEKLKTGIIGSINSLFIILSGILILQFEIIQRACRNQPFKMAYLHLLMFSKRYYVCSEQ